MKDKKKKRKKKKVMWIETFTLYFENGKQLFILIIGAHKCESNNLWGDIH